MDFPIECDMVIVGGGLSGCATAYYLAKGGMEVVVVERRSIASGATGRNGSCLTQLDGREMTVNRVRKRLFFVGADIELLRGLDDELGRDIELQQFGSMDLASSEEESEELRNLVGIQKTGGDDATEFLDRKSLRDVCPVLEGNIYDSKFCLIDGSVNPIKMCWAFALTAYERYRVLFITQTRVERISFIGGKACGVRTSLGEIIARSWVINCTNACSPDIEPSIAVFPVLNVVAVTERVPPLPIITWEYTYKGYYYYGTSQKNRSLIIGGHPTIEPETREEHFSESTSFEDLKRFANVLYFLYPSLKDVSFTRIWAGTFAMTIDRLPYVGPMPGYDHYFINTGYSNGMGYCLIGAKLTAEYILNKGRTSMPLDTLRPDRFTGMKFEIPRRCSYKLLEKFIGEWNL
ncbi:MAG: NAD(P)/FAD-dependent oxidoreductase [Thermodesulfovibrionales bacterium]